VAAALGGVRSRAAFDGVRWRAALADLRGGRRQGGPDDSEAGREARRGARRARLEELAARQARRRCRTDGCAVGESRFLGGRLFHVDDPKPVMGVEFRSPLLETV
jgi:hypothetical protein